MGAQKQKEARHRLEVARRVVGRIAHSELTHVFDSWHLGVQQERAAREEAGREEHLAELRSEISSHQDTLALHAKTVHTLSLTHTLSLSLTHRVREGTAHDPHTLTHSHTLTHTHTHSHTLTLQVLEARDALEEEQERASNLEESHAALALSTAALEDVHADARFRERERRLEMARRVVGRMSHGELTHVFDAWSQPSTP